MKFYYALTAMLISSVGFVGLMFLDPVYGDRTWMNAGFVVGSLFVGAIGRHRVDRLLGQLEEANEQLVGLSTVDGLTDLFNRRALMSESERLFALQRRSNKRLAVFMMDLDHFKQINDQFGHAVGDDVLVRFVQLVDAACRPSDRLFRLGGEEFVLLVPNVTREGLNGVATKIQQCVREVLRRPDGQAVTVSIGGCMLNGHPERESWLHEADACLYAAKDAGRDQIVIAAP